eukprot:g24570.t1
MKYAPAPKDVAYEDLLASPWQRQVSHLFGYVLIFTVFLLFFPFIGLASIITSSSWLQSFLEGIFATLLLSLFMSFLPTTLSFIIDKTFTLTSRAESQLYLQEWYYWFQVIFVLLVTAVGTSLWQRFNDVLTSPKGVLFLGTGVGSRSARLSLVLAIGLVFSLLSPFILIVVFLFFLINRLVFGYLLVFAELPKPDLGGIFWAQQLRHVHLILPIFVLTMSGCIWEYSRWSDILWETLPFRAVVEGAERGTDTPLTLISLNAAITAVENAWQVALAMLASMPAQALVPDQISFSAAMTACGSSRHWFISLDMLREMHLLLTAWGGAQCAVSPEVILAVQDEWTHRLELLGESTHFDVTEWQHLCDPVLGSLWAADFSGLVWPRFRAAVRRAMLWGSRWMDGETSQPSAVQEAGFRTAYQPGCSRHMLRQAPMRVQDRDCGRIWVPRDPPEALHFDEKLMIFKPSGWEVENPSGSSSLCAFLIRILGPRPIFQDARATFGFLHRLDYTSTRRLNAYSARVFAGYLTTSSCSWAVVRIATGRRHQIRVHLAFEGRPSYGDAMQHGTTPS